MLTLFADETGISWDEKIGFFMYGGIVLGSSDIRDLTSEVIAIKDRYGIDQSRPLKWNNKKLDGKVLEAEVHRMAKEELLTAFSKTTASIIVCLSPHRFYHHPEVKDDGNITMCINPTTLLRTHKYAMNDLLKKYSEFLGDKKEGIVIVDNFGDGIRRELTQHCEKSFPYWDNIVLPVIQQDDEKCIPLQVNDVVLGAIQCSLKDDSELNFLPQIRNQFWSVRSENVNRVSGYGFNIYPLAPYAKSYQNANKNLRTKFRRKINA
jgi:hypothetical protein